ncbi:MAG: CBS domain-containing protein [Planctomycetales bacterium]|nr:CBS domain-containing protein [Planctomycetales bacterium]
MNDFLAHDPDKFEDPLANFDPKEYESSLQEALVERTVGQIPPQPAQRISPTDTVRDAVQKMAQGNLASLLVVDQQGCVIGIFTERDVLDNVAEQYERVADHAISEVMTADPAVVYDSDPSAAAIASIAVAGHRHVPVLGVGGSLIGTLEPRHVFAFMEKYFDK